LKDGRLRTGQERIEEMHKKARAIERHERIVRARVIGIAAACASVMLIVLIAFNTTFVRFNKIWGSENPEFTGSIFAEPNSYGFVLVGVLAFALGVLVTVLCYHLRRRVEDQEETDRW